MAIHKTAYDTVACQGYQLQKTLDQLKVTATHGFMHAQEGTGVYLVEGGDSSAEAIPAFAHPVLFERAGEQKIAMDVRPFGSWDRAQHKFVTRNSVEYKIALHRAHLNDIWVSHSQLALRDVSVLPLGVFASWVSENVAKRYALDPLEQFKLMVYAAIFYLSNFMSGDTIEDHEKARMAAAIAKACRCQAKDVLEVMDEDTDVTTTAGKGCPVIANSIHFCNIVSGISIRMKELSAGVLFSIIGNTWFGANAKEMVAVALEHPPTWIAILVAAFNERTYKHSGITRVTERKGNRAAGEDYVRAVLNLLAVKTHRSDDTPGLVVSAS